MSWPYNSLSNFFTCGIQGTVAVKDGDGSVKMKKSHFPSSEHYFWAHFMSRECDISRLCVGGDLGGMEGLILLLGEKSGRSKVKYWSKKNNVGIVAKTLALQRGDSRFRAKNLGIEMSIDMFEEGYGPRRKLLLARVWRKILMDKFGQNTPLREILISTGDEVLVEFCRANPEKQFWTGQVKNGVKKLKGLTEGGDIVGNNFMGKCVCATRREFQ